MTGGGGEGGRFRLSLVDGDAKAGTGGSERCGFGFFSEPFALLLVWMLLML